MKYREVKGHAQAHTAIQTEGLRLPLVYWAEKVKVLLSYYTTTADIVPKTGDSFQDLFDLNQFILIQWSNSRSSELLLLEYLSTQSPLYSVGQWGQGSCALPLKTVSKWNNPPKSLNRVMAWWLLRLWWKSVWESSGQARAEEGGKVWHLFDRFALQAFSSAESPHHPLPPAITTNSFIIRKSESSFALSQVCYTIGWMELQIRFFLCRTQWSSLGHMGHGHCLGVHSTMFSLNNWASPSKEMRKYKANKLEILRREG